MARKIIKLTRQYLADLRKKETLSQRRMASALGISSYQHYVRYENGERDFSAKKRIEYFTIISHKFNISISDLYRAERKYLLEKFSNDTDFLAVKNFREEYPNATVNECYAFLYPEHSHTAINKYWKLISLE